MMSNKALRIIISGGGTGGHIFPAISIAKKMKELNPDRRYCSWELKAKWKWRRFRQQDSKSSACR